MGTRIMGETVNLELSANVPPIFLGEPMFCLEFRFHHNYARLLGDNLVGLAPMVSMPPVVLQIEPQVLAHASICYHYFHQLFSTWGESEPVRFFLVSSIANYLTSMAREQPSGLSGFHVVAHVEFVHGYDQGVDDVHVDINVHGYQSLDAAAAYHSEESLIMMDAEDDLAPEPRSRGVSRSVLRKLEKEMSFAAAEDGTISGECPICLEGFCGDQVLRKKQLFRMPSCAHIFHVKCITRWLKDQNSCPLCRYEIN